MYALCITNLNTALSLICKTIVKASKIRKGESILIREYIPSEETGLPKLKSEEFASLKSKTTSLQYLKIEYQWEVLFSNNMNNLTGLAV